MQHFEETFIRFILYLGKKLMVYPSSASEFEDTTNKFVIRIRTQKQHILGDSNEFRFW